MDTPATTPIRYTPQQLSWKWRCSPTAIYGRARKLKLGSFAGGALTFSEDELAQLRPNKRRGRPRIKR